MNKKKTRCDYFRWTIVVRRSDLHHFGDIPDTDLSPLGCSCQKLWTAAKTIAGNFVRTISTVGKLGWTCRQCH